VVTVAVESGRREDLGQPVEQLEGRETQGGAAGQVGLREDVEDLIGAAADEVETFESEGGPGAIADQPFEAGPVGGLDADAGVEAEPAAVIPGEHVLDVVGLEEVVAAIMPQDAGTDGVLEALEELGGEGGGLVEAEAGFWVGRILIGVILDGLRVGEGPERSGDRRRGVGVGAVRGGNAMNVRGVRQVGQISGRTS
jgi:hypothetical protein